MARNKSVTRQCIVCQRQFHPNYYFETKAKYCSLECFHKHYTHHNKDIRKKISGKLKGYVPWNKGKKGVQTAWCKGLHIKINDALDKWRENGGQAWNKGKKLHYQVWNKGKKRTDIIGENHWLWKGDKVSYGNLHLWVRRHLGEPSKCIYCGKSKGRLHWANISRKYKRDLKDFMSLCVSCHKKYDLRKIVI